MRQMNTQTWAIIFAVGALLLASLATVLLRVMNKRDLAAEPGPGDGATEMVVKGKK